METEAYTACVMYSPEGATRRVETFQLESALMQQGWASTPFPPLPEPAKPQTIEQRLAAIEDLLSQHDAILMQRRGGRPKKEE
jgi:hypothetical protein